MPGMELGFWRLLSSSGAESLPLKQRIPELAHFQGKKLLACYHSSPKGLLLRRPACETSADALLDRLLESAARRLDTSELAPSTPVAILRRPAAGAHPARASVLTAGQLLALLEGECDEGAEWTLQSLVTPAEDLRVVVVFTRIGEERLDVVGRRYSSVYGESCGGFDEEVVVGEEARKAAEAKTRAVLGYVERFHGKVVQSLIAEFLVDSSKRLLLHGFWRAVLEEEKPAAKTVEDVAETVEEEKQEVEEEKTALVSTTAGESSFRRSLLSDVEEEEEGAVTPEARPALDSSVASPVTPQRPPLETSVSLSALPAESVVSPERPPRPPPRRPRPSSANASTVRSRQPPATSRPIARPKSADARPRSAEARPRSAEARSRPPVHAKQVLSRYDLERELQPRLTATLGRQMERYREMIPFWSAQQTALACTLAKRERALLEKRKELERLQAEKKSAELLQRDRMQALSSGLAREQAKARREREAAAAALRGSEQKEAEIAQALLMEDAKRRQLQSSLDEAVRKLEHMTVDLERARQLSNEEWLAAQQRPAAPNLAAELREMEDSLKGKEQLRSQSTALRAELLLAQDELRRQRQYSQRMEDFVKKVATLNGRQALGTAGRREAERLLASAAKLRSAVGLEDLQS